MTLNNETEKLMVEVPGSGDPINEDCLCHSVKVNFSADDTKNLVKGFADAVQQGYTIDLPLFIRDLKSAIVKEIDRRRVNQTKASERLCLNRGSYRKYLARALQKTGDTNA